MTEPSAKQKPQSTALATAPVHPASHPDRPLPPIDDFAIHIDREGRWFYHGSPIGRPAIVKLFASVLRRNEDGYWLVTPAERGRITVEDVPFVAVSLRIDNPGPDQRLVFRTNLDAEITAGPGHPIRIAGLAADRPRPYIQVSPELEARIARSAYYELMAIAVPETDDAVSEDEGRDHEADPPESLRYGVWSAGQFFPLT
jgi:uncharacterized protein